MATTEQIQALADLAYAAQTTGVPTAVYDAAKVAVGIDPGDYLATQELLESYGYAPGSSSGFYKNSTLNNSPLDEGLAAHYNAVNTAINEYGYLESTEENLNQYSGKINPETGEPYKFIVNDNVANAEFINNYLQGQGSTGADSVAITPTEESSWKDIAASKYTESYDDSEARSAQYYGDGGAPIYENSLQWAMQTKKVVPTTGGGTDDVGTGLTGTGTVADGSGGISGGYTADPDTLGIPDSAVLPTFTNGVSQVSPGASGTYTVPAQTFEDNITNQVESFRERAAAQDFTNPQTMAEKQAAGEDVSSYAISQKLYRNPNTGHQLYIPFQGDQPLQAIPAGYYEVNQQTGTMGTGVFNPVTAGGNTATGANSGGYIQGFNDASIPNPNPIDPSQIYGNVSFQDPVTGEIVTQTAAEYMQSLANKQAQATFNPATSVTMPGVSTMAELGYEYNEDGTIKLDPATGQPITKELMPGTVIESTAGQAQALAPVVTGEQIAQVSDVVQAKGPGTPAIYDEQGNLLSAAVEIPGAATAGLTTAAPGVATQLEGLEASQLSGPTQTITGQTADSTMVSGLDAATGQSVDVTGAPTRTLQAGETIEGTGVDQAAVQAAFGAGEVQAASVQDELAGLMQQFEGGETPAWAAGSMRRATQMLAARGLGASSLAGQAVIQAAMEAALPIAQIDAGNKQQMALFKAEQRAKFLQMDFDQAFQAKVMNAARVSEIANMNFSAEQQIALENSRAANTMELNNLSNKQALIMAEAAALSQLDMANLNNLQQAQVQNAQNFLQIDMANLNNAQSTALFKAQQVTNAMLSDAAQANATAQFNATSANQTNQFFSNLAAQVSQFNAAQQNAINQFNAEEANAILEFNSALQNQREMFNAQNYLVVAQANAQWRQNINTTNTEAQNVANLTYAKEVNGLTQKALDDYWQKERDIMSYAFAQSEGAADRALKIMLGEMDLDALRTKLDFAEDNAKAEFWSDLIFGDMSFSDVFKLPKVT